MHSKRRFAGAVAILAAALALWVWNTAATPRDDSRVGAPASRSGVSEIDEGGDNDAPDPSLATPVAPAAPMPLETELWSPSITRAKGYFWGHVIWEDGSPVVGARIDLRPSCAPSPLKLEFAEDRAVAPTHTVSGPEGRFRFTRLPTGPYAIDISHAEAIRQSTFAVATAEGSDVVIQLERHSAQGTLDHCLIRLEDDQHHPLAGAELRIWSDARSDYDNPSQFHIADDHGEVLLGEGLFREVVRGNTPLGSATHGEVPTSAILEARHGELAAIYGQRDLSLLRSHVHWENDAGEALPILTITLRPLARVSGKIFFTNPTGDDTRNNNTALGKLEFFSTAWQRSALALRTMVQRVTPAKDHSFEVTLPAGAYNVRWRGQRGYRAEIALGRRRYPSKMVDGTQSYCALELKAGATVNLEVKLVSAGRIAGVVTHNGIPVDQATVRAFWRDAKGAINRNSSDKKRRALAPYDHLSGRRNFEHFHPIVARQTNTNAEGRYQFENLPPGKDWQVEVLATPYSYERRHDFVVTDGETTTLEHSLELAGVIQGVAWGGVWLQLERRRSREPRDPNYNREPSDSEMITFQAPYSATAPFAIPGLAAGTYSFSALPKRFGAATYLTDVEVRADEITWIDLRVHSPFVVKGRVTLKGAPLADCRVSIETGHSLTNAQGEFAYSLGQTPTRGVRIAILPLTVTDAVGIEFARVYDTEREPPTEPLFELFAGELRVRVFDSTGTQIPATVRLNSGASRQDQAGWNNYRRQLEAPGLVRNVTCQRSTDNNLEARFATLTRGLHRLSVTAGDAIIPPRVVEMGALSESGEVIASLLEEFHLRGGASVEVDVRNGEGGPLVGRTVYLTLGIGTRNQDIYSRAIGASGRAEFRHVPPGPITLSTSTGGFGFWQGRQDLEVAEGEHRYVEMIIK